jgi:alpha-galactosidase
MKVQAKLMVSMGFLKAGYEFIIVDDCWLAKERDENGLLQPDKDRFPSGIKALADYVP